MDKDFDFTVITIDAHKWFDRVNGNTYHSVAVFVDGRLVGVNPFEYGYGDQYLVTAHKILQKADVFPETGEWLPSGMAKDYSVFRSYMLEHPRKFVVLVVDVPNRRDLHQGGRAPRLVNTAKGSRAARRKSAPWLGVKGVR